MDRYDLAGGAGLLTTGVGVWLWSPRVALVVVGLLLTAGAWVAATFAARAEADDETKDAG